MSDAPSQLPSNSASRFAFVDALRGIAAISVAGFHLYLYEPPPENSQLFWPFFVDRWLIWGWVGVQFLLVISGFVIAYSFRDGRVSISLVANFLLRRLIRLSPPYIVTLILVLVLHEIAVRCGGFPSPLDDSPSVGRVASHLIYAQDLFGYLNLSAGLWTVCIEVQFYVLFGIGLLVARHVWPVVREGQTIASPRVVAVLFAPLALMSLFDWGRQETLEPYVIYFFSLFYLGMITWWAIDGSLPHSAYWLTVGVFVVRFNWQWQSEVLVGLIASLAIYAAGRSGHLHDWYAYWWLQYLGKISYSLYLVHYAVSHVVTHLAWKGLGGSPTPVQSAGVLVLSLVASIGAAHLMFVWVEGPSHRWSARLKTTNAAAA